MTQNLKKKEEEARENKKFEISEEETREKIQFHLYV